MTIITVADTETTGFRSDKGHRIIEFCAAMFDLESRQHLRTYTFRINPLRDIPADATRVHGIYLEDLVDAPTWEKTAPLVNKILTKTDLFVAHNCEFDATFIGEELLRVGIAPPDVPMFCTMKNGRWATPNGKNPKLGELCWALQVEYDPAKAHAAEYDVQKTAECLWRGLDARLYSLPTLH